MGGNAAPLRRGGLHGSRSVGAEGIRTRDVGRGKARQSGYRATKPVSCWKRRSNNGCPCSRTMARSGEQPSHARRVTVGRVKTRSNEARRHGSRQRELGPRKRGRILGNEGKASAGVAAGGSRGPSPRFPSGGRGFREVFCGCSLTTKSAAENDEEHLSQGNDRLPPGRPRVAARRTTEQREVGRQVVKRVREAGERHQ